MVYMIVNRPYNPDVADTLRFDLGNLVAERVTGDPKGDYFKETATGKILQFDGQNWQRRDDVNAPGVFCRLNGALTTFVAIGGMVTEFRASALPDA